MQKAIISIRPLISAALISTMLGGCAGTTVSETDPWEGWNRQVLGFNDEFDTVVINPLSTAYSSVVPEFVNDGLGNFFSNINDIGVTVNDLLQLKIEQGGMDASRFLVNTTTGLFGFIDVAKMMGLPKHNEDFGQTLGFWGVPSGDYLVVPFLGASSPRELVGVIGDALMNPLTYSFVFAGSGTLFRALSAANSPRQVAGVLGTAVGTAVMDPLTYPFAVFGSGPVVSNALDPEPHLVRFNDADAAA
ncbi:MAG: VacJ family lipoprotein, partial [Methylobacter sp.]|nr:VacJ family lipoprotein [Methylobacter sp.]